MPTVGFSDWVQAVQCLLNYIIFSTLPWAISKGLQKVDEKDVLWKKLRMDLQEFCTKTYLFDFFTFRSTRVPVPPSHPYSPDFSLPHPLAGPPAPFLSLGLCSKSCIPQTGKMKIVLCWRLLGSSVGLGSTFKKKNLASMNLVNPLLPHRGAKGGIHRSQRDENVSFITELSTERN